MFSARIVGSCWSALDFFSLRLNAARTNNERIDLDSMRDYSVYEEEYNTTVVCYK